MRRLALIGLLILALLTAIAATAVAGDDGKKLRATLDGFGEVPVNSTAGRGRFEARIEGTTISYKLTYSGLQGTAQQAHIHLGQRAANGGIIAFLCGGGGKPACPASGTVSGTIVAADVIGPATQGIGLGELGEAIRAMRAGMTYANVHTSTFGGGEIRGQVRGGGRDNEGNEDDD